MRLMKDTGKIVIFITTRSESEAHIIARLLLEHKMAACINIVPTVDSIYWWQDSLESAHESLLIIKTKSSQLNQIIEVVKEHHGYEVPEIIAMPIIGGNADYLKWIDSEVKD